MVTPKRSPQRRWTGWLQTLAVLNGDGSGWQYPGDRATLTAGEAAGLRRAFWHDVQVVSR